MEERDKLLYSIYKEKNIKVYNYRKRGNIIKKVYSPYLLGNNKVYNFLLFIEDYWYSVLKAINYLRIYNNYCKDKNDINIL